MLSVLTQGINQRYHEEHKSACQVHKSDARSREGRNTFLFHEQHNKNTIQPWTKSSYDRSSAVRLPYFSVKPLGPLHHGTGPLFPTSYTRRQGR